MNYNNLRIFLFSLLLAPASTTLGVLVPQSIADAYNQARQTGVFVTPSHQNVPYTQLALSECDQRGIQALSYHQAILMALRALPNLTTLNFVKYNFPNTSILSMLARTITKMGQLRNVIFTDTNIAQLNAKNLSIIAMIEHSSSIRSLTFGENELWKLTEETAPIFKRMLCQMRLDTLSIEQHDTEPDDAYLRIIAKALASMRLQKLRLVLCTNLPADIAQAIAHIPTLTHLNLTMTFVDELDDYAWASFISMLGNLRHLTHLALDECLIDQLSEQRFEQLCRAIQQLNTLQSLDLSGNDLSVEPNKQVQTAEYMNNKKWAFLGQTLSNLRNLRELILDRCLMNDMNNYCWNIFANALTTMTNLRTLSLKRSININHDSLMTATCWRLFSRAISYSNIQNVCMQECNFKMLDTESWHQFTLLCASRVLLSIKLSTHSFIQQQILDLAQIISPWVYTGLMLPDDRTGEGQRFIGAMPH